MGIIGGISWESTAHYYAALNEGVKSRLGGLHSAQVLLWSVDFAEIEQLQRTGDWERAGDIFADIAKRLEQAGAQCIVIAANTMHRVADRVSDAVSIPLLHIGDATAQAVLDAGKTNVLLLGTRYTMEQPFIKERLSSHGLQIVVPNEDDMSLVHRIIYEELCLGIVKPESRRRLLDVISRNAERKIEGVILGCTELAMILQPEHLDLPLFDTTSIHVDAALAFTLDE